VTEAHSNPFNDAAVAAEYDAWFKTALGATVDRLEKALVTRLATPWPGEAALDVGTGTGHYAAFLAELGVQVTGVDPSREMLAVARARGIPVDWRQADATALPFTDASFDLVLSVTMLEFVAEPAAALAEMFRVVRPGGRLVVATLNADGPWARARRREVTRTGSPYAQARFLSARQFAALLGGLGTVTWSSAVHIGPHAGGARHADAVERLGQALCRGRGALLVGRVSK